MRSLLRYTLFFLLLGSSGFAVAQIVDDSTRREFGPFSTFTYTDTQFFDDTLTLTTIDSSFLNQHQYDWAYRNGTFYQNLGNSITPSVALTYTPYANVMQQMAPDRFAQFRYPERMYYNTKSPYSFMKYSQGFLGDQIFEGMFTQNVSPQLNFGGEFFRGVSKKQFGTNGSNDKLGLTWYFRGFMSYYSENERYHALLDFVNHGNRFNEQWGMTLISPSTFQRDTSAASIDYALYRGFYAEADMSNGSSAQKYREVHLQQRYTIISSYIGVYMKNKFRWDKRFYTDPKLTTAQVINGTDTTTGPYFYPEFRYRSDTTMDERYFNSLENEVGFFIKGKYWNATMGYLQQHYGYEISYQERKVWGAPVLLKSSLNLYLNDETRLRGVLLYGLHGTHDAKITLFTKYGNAGYHTLNSSPYLTDNYLNSNHLYWENDFKNVFTNTLFATAEVKGKPGLLSSKISYTNVQNPIYYGEDWQPHQIDRIAGILQSSNRGLLTVRHWNLEQMATITYTSSPIVQIPEYMLQSKLYFLGKLFHNIMGAQLGVEVNWRSTYYGNGYLPLLQDFYVQHQLATFGYPVMHVFGNFNLKTVDLFARVGHVNQYVGRSGYMVTPFYPGKRLNFVFGVKWRFYD